MSVETVSHAGDDVVIVRYSAASQARKIDAIKAEVCAMFDVRLIDMISHRRGRAVARPRQVAMYLARELTPLSLPAIGRHFGNRDHTTVMHALDVVERLLKDDTEIQYHVEQIRQHLLEGVEHGRAGAAGQIGLGPSRLPMDEARPNRPFQQRIQRDAR